VTRRFLLLFVILILSAISAAQTLPPPAFAGQSYWFGPGPAALSSTGFTQDTGGYSELYKTSGTWTAGVNGGPAFSHNDTQPTYIASYFNVSTDLVVEPYIYVDGYFGTTATVSGFSGGAVGLGSSRFYVIHNVPIRMAGIGFSDLNQVPSGASLTIAYDIVYSGYTNPGYSNTIHFTTDNGIGGHFDVTISNTDDNGILQVEPHRSATLPNNLAAATYHGVGTIWINAL